MLAKRRKYVRLAAASCPSCREKGGIKKIVFGMPGADFDFDKYIVGGCCVTEKDPEIGCVNCGWEGLRQDLIQD